MEDFNVRPSDIRAELEALGWSQTQFADRIGVHQNTVSKWMTGKAEMPGPAVAYLALAATITRLAKNL